MGPVAVVVSTVTNYCINKLVGVANDTATKYKASSRFGRGTRIRLFRLINTGRCEEEICGESQIGEKIRKRTKSVCQRQTERVS